MNSWACKVASAAIFGCALTAGTSHAQMNVTPVSVSNTANVPGAQMVYHVMGSTPSVAVVNCDDVINSRMQQKLEECRLEFIDHWNGYGLNCWGNMRNIGCGSWQRTFIFQFGTCRQFFGERCCPGAPPSCFDSGMPCGYKRYYN